MAEAMEVIRTQALSPPKLRPGLEQHRLRAYLRDIDLYSDYLTANEYNAFLQANISDYFGVQMDIQQKGDVLILHPFKGGIAEKAGIKSGDELMAVDGGPVNGYSVYVVGSRIRGAEGKTIQLTIRSGGGIPRTMTLRRQKTRFEPVRLRSGKSAYVIQVVRFIDGTDTRMASVLESLYDQTKPLLIDLRGNQGGSLNAARRCAELFLNEGALLYTLRYPSTVESVVASRGRSVARQIVLLQDRNTASAAEMFIAALTGNGKALSVGERSYGKGLVQRFFPLSDGSALLLTHAELITPGGLPYDGHGLDPDLSLPADMIARDYSQDIAQSNLFELINTTHH